MPNVGQNLNDSEGAIYCSVAHPQTDTAGDDYIKIYVDLIRWFQEAIATDEFREVKFKGSLLPWTNGNSSERLVVSKTLLRLAPTSTMPQTMCGAVAVQNLPSNVIPWQCVWYIQPIGGSWTLEHTYDELQSFQPGH